MNRFGPPPRLVAGLLFAWLAAAPPAPCSAAAVEDARQQAETVCAALTKGDAGPMTGLFARSDIGARTIERLKSRIAIAPSDEKVVALRVELGWKEAAVTWAGIFKGGRFRLLSTREDAGAILVSVRMEGGDIRGYWRFRFRAAPGGVALENLELPLLAADFISLAADQTPAAVHPPARQVNPLARLASSLLLRLVVIVMILFTAYAAYRHSHGAAQGISFFRHPTFFAFICGLVTVCAIGFMRPQEAPPPSPQAAAEWELHRAKVRIATLSAAGRHEEAEAAARLQLVKHPGDLVLRLALGNSLLALKKYGEAKPIFDAMLAGGEAPLLAHNQLAAIALETGKYVETVSHLEAVLAELGDDDAMLVGIARARMLAGDSEAALAQVNRALELDPRSIDGLECRARIAARRDDLAAAARDLRALRALYKLDATALAEDRDFSKLANKPEFADIFQRKAGP